MAKGSKDHDVEMGDAGESDAAIIARLEAMPVGPKQKKAYTDTFLAMAKAARPKMLDWLVERIAETTRQFLYMEGFLQAALDNNKPTCDWVNARAMSDPERNSMYDYVRANTVTAAGTAHNISGFNLLLACKTERGLDIAADISHALCRGNDEVRNLVWKQIPEEKQAAIWGRAFLDVARHADVRDMKHLMKIDDVLPRVDSAIYVEILHDFRNARSVMTPQARELVLGLVAERPDKDSILDRVAALSRPPIPGVVGGASSHGQITATPEAASLKR